MRSKLRRNYYYWVKTASRRARTSLVILILGIIILSIFTYLNLDTEVFGLKLLLISATAASLLNLIILIKTRNIDISNITSSIILFILSISLLSLGGKEATGYLWTYPLCAIAILTLSFNMGVLYSITYLICAVSVFMFSHHLPVTIEYETVLFSRYIASCITLFVACLASVYVQEHYFKTIKKINKKLKSSAYTDSLTQLHNRRYFKKSLIKDTYFNRDITQNSCVLLIDVDHFKPINDQLGHDAGDEALKMIASIIKNHLREDDLIVRWGGEEFLAVLYKSDMTISIERAEQLRKAVEDYNVLTNLVGHPVTISIGISQINNEQSAKEIIKKADELLYQAKETGRNKVIGETNHYPNF